MLGKPHSAIALCLSFVVLLVPASPYDRNDYDSQDQVISSLNRVLDFYRREFKSINLDGIFGLRVAQGAFLSIMNDVRDGQLNVENHVLNQVKGLYNKASVIAGDALPFLKQSAPAYFKKFRKQVSDPWVNFKPFTSKKLLKRQYDPQKRRNVISFDEETSDHCMSELTGTGSSSNSNKPCQISDRCWGLISAEGAEGYTLTHQALFLQLGEVQGCTLSLLKRLEQSHISGGLEEIYNRICSDMYPQMTAIERRGESNHNFRDRDLYMEQAMVCASAGYHNFLSSKRLRRILAWQRKDGCFGEQKHVYQDKKIYQDTDTDEQQNEKIDNLGNNFDTPFSDIKQSLEDEYSKILRKPLSVSMRTMRSLLVEKELDDGCMSHLTGVATGLLGIYLRWLLYPKVQQEKMAMEKLQDHNQLSTKEKYSNDNLAGVIAQRETQLQQQKKMKEGQLQSAHLRQMRRAAMLGNSAQELLIKEGSGSIPWGVVVLGTCCVFLVLWVMFVKGFKGSLHKLKTVTLTKKSSHVI